MNVTDSKKSKIKRINHYEKTYEDKRFINSIVFRILVLLILLGLITIPVSMLEKRFDDQISQQQSDVKELANKWGNEQTIIGPILSIPYVERISRIETQIGSDGSKSSVSKDIFNNKTLMLLPENLRIKADLKEKILTQNELQTHVYQGEIELSGNFNLESLPESTGFNTIEWDKAIVAIGFNENKSIEVSSPLQWAGGRTGFKPGAQLSTTLGQGVHANLENVANDNNLPDFTIQLNIKGKDNFKFAPLGESTSASITSDYSKMQVQGDIPAKSKVNTNNSFEASWRINNLIRSYPQQWLIEEGKNTVIKHDFSKTLAGVEMKPSAQVTTQSFAKIKSILPYLVPIIAVLFLSLIVLEFQHNNQPKPKFIHYLIIACVVLLTPLMLLALSNIIRFEQAYQITATTSIIVMVFYIMSVLRNFIKTFYMLLVIGSLYGALYVYLQISDFSLLAVGTAGIFITLLLMIASINIQEFTHVRVRITRS